jgi:phosphoenolpyruvate---glycerone phosphotransferase subunit DhaL
MERMELSLQETKEMFLYVADQMIASKEMLTAADSVIGDGDHGIGMANGFQAVKEKLIAEEFTSQGKMCQAIGFALMMSIGGASGAIFGTLYQGAAKPLEGHSTFTSVSLNILLENGLEAVKKRGKAKPGDKSMVDALEPAALASVNYRDTHLLEALEAASNAAESGMEKTKDMIARIGRAKSLNERSLGHPDPGAISTYLQLSFMAEFVAEMD